MNPRRSTLSLMPRGMGNVYLRGSTWWIVFFRDGVRHRESSKSARKEDAEDLLKQRLGQSVTGSLPAPRKTTVGDLLDLVLEDYITNERKSLYDTKLRIDAQVRPEFGSIRVADLCGSHITRFIVRRRTEGRSNGAINRELSILRRGLCLGNRRDSGPGGSKALFVPKLKENNVRTGFVTDAQYAALLKALPEHLKLLLIIGYHTGARKGEITPLKWEQIDLAAGEIRLNAGETKNDEGRILPIYGPMREALAEAANRRKAEAKRMGVFPSPYLFPDGSTHIQSFRKAWASACVRAGVPGQLFHDLRRSAIRNMERSGIPRGVAMKISGHKTEAVYRRYDIVTRKDIQDAARKLEQSR